MASGNVSILLDGAETADDVGGGKKEGKGGGGGRGSMPPPGPPGPPGASSGLLSVPAPGGVFPLANSQQVASSSSGSGSATGNPRSKVALKKGFSLMDWIRLTKSGEDLAGTGGRLRAVTGAELKAHNKRSDAWMAIDGKVYNVTRYMDYHPGGWDELVRGAGKDATDLFNEVHRWVNYESMLAACLIGKLQDGGGETDDESAKKKSSSASPTFARPSSLPSAKPVIPPIKPKVQKPTHDFHQTNAAFVLSIYTREPRLEASNVIAEVSDSGLKLTCLVQMPATRMAYSIALSLSEAQVDLDRVRVNGSGKAEVALRKRQPGRKASARVDADRFCRAAELDTRYRDWTLEARERVTHDVDHIVLKYPKGQDALFFRVPLGHHVQIRCTVEGMEIARSYTPVINSLNGRDEDDDEDDDGQVRLHFLIKTYSDGALTPALKATRVGGRVSVSDHGGKFSAAADMPKMDGGGTVLLLAAGTGFTPMAKLILHCLQRRREDDVCLVFFNKTEEDIVWREEMEELCESNSRFRACHVLSQAGDGWRGARGRVSGATLREAAGAATMKTATFAAVCGPNPFVDRAREVLDDEFGLRGEKVFVFQG